MKLTQVIRISAIVFGIAMLIGCSSSSTSPNWDKTAAGTVIGAAAGAGVGEIIHHNSKGSRLLTDGVGAAVGGVIGGIAGNALGSKEHTDNVTEFARQQGREAILQQSSRRVNATIDGKAYALNVVYSSVPYPIATVDISQVESGGYAKNVGQITVQ